MMPKSTKRASTYSPPGWSLSPRAVETYVMGGAKPVGGVTITPKYVGDRAIVQAAGYLQQFLSRGGVVAWGAVITDGPISSTVERPWRQLSELWCRLVERGCDHLLLRQQSMISPECGLGVHSQAVAERVFQVAGELGKRVHDQATASRFVLGA